LGWGAPNFLGKGGPTESRGGYTPCARNEKCGWQGFTAVDAYKKAGYKRHDGNACTLAKHPEILARLEEIRGEGEWPVGTRAIAARAKVTVESLIDDSEKVLQRAMEINQLGATNTAIKGKAILSGNWVESVEIGTPGEFDAMTDEELERALIERVQKLGLLERAQQLGFADFGETQDDEDEAQH
jgi:hypothetical protein